MSNNFTFKCFNLYLMRVLYSTGVLSYTSSHSPNLAPQTTVAPVRHFSGGGGGNRGRVKNYSILCDVILDLGDVYCYFMGTQGPNK